MKAPSCIWAADGETPYYYEDGEDRPATAVRYVRSDIYADVLQELDGVLKMIGDDPTAK